MSVFDLLSETEAAELSFFVSSVTPSFPRCSNLPVCGDCTAN